MCQNEVRNCLDCVARRKQLCCDLGSSLRSPLLLPGQYPDFFRSFEVRISGPGPTYSFLQVPLCIVTVTWAVNSYLTFTISFTMYIENDLEIVLLQTPAHTCPDLSYHLLAPWVLTVHRRFVRVMAACQRLWGGPGAHLLLGLQDQGSQAPSPTPPEAALAPARLVRSRAFPLLLLRLLILSGKVRPESHFSEGASPPVLALSEQPPSLTLCGICIPRCDTVTAQDYP